MRSDILDYLQSMLGRGDPEAAGAAQASTAMEPVTGQYMSDVASGQYAKQGVQNLTGAYQWDPNQGPIDNARAQAKSPLALDQAMNVAMGVGPGAIRAYHGSPYNFEKFDSSKIGDGEGAQAFGHGLYFAENEAVARGYRDKLAPNKLGPMTDVLPEYYKPGNIVPGYGGMDRVLEYKPNGDFGFAVKVEEVNSRGETVGHPRWHKTTPTPQQIEQVLGKNLGHMYEVDIHADPHQLLDLDKPLSQQGAPVRDALRDVIDQQARFRELRPNSTAPELTGAGAYNRLPMFMEGMPRNTFNVPGSAISAELAQRGVPGLRYLDGSSRGAGQGTHNYVTFPGSDNLIEILRKYGIAGLLGGTAAASGQGEQ